MKSTFTKQDPIVFSSKFLVPLRTIDKTASIAVEVSFVLVSIKKNPDSCSPRASYLYHLDLYYSNIILKPRTNANGY